MAAANTFFQANPDHVEMRQNLEYYRMMAGVQEEDFKDLEARTHMVRQTLCIAEWARVAQAQCSLLADSCSKSHLQGEAKPSRCSDP